MIQTGVPAPHAAPRYIFSRPLHPPTQPTERSSPCILADSGCNSWAGPLPVIGTHPHLLASILPALLLPGLPEGAPASQQPSTLVVPSGLWWQHGAHNCPCRRKSQPHRRRATGSSHCTGQASTILATPVATVGTS